MFFNSSEVMNIGIIVDTNFRIPPITGFTYRLYYLSKQLSLDRVSIKIFVCNRSVVNDSCLKLFRDNSGIEFHVIPEDVFYCLEKMEGIIEKNKIDVLQFEDCSSLLRYSRISAKLRKPTCLIMHDVEPSLRKMLGCHQKEIKKSLNESRKACLIANMVVCFSEFDRRELIDKVGVGKDKIILNHLAIDCNEFKRCRSARTVNKIVFVGNMHYEPNKDAVLTILKKVAPKVIGEVKKAKFYFIGMAPNSLRRMASKNIVFTGEVGNLSKFLGGAAVALCPVEKGSGMKVKILNYCAAGLPVITTSLGASGYEKIKSLIVDDDISTYHERVLHLLHNKILARSIGFKNRQSVKEFYSIKSASATMRAAYDYLFTITDSFKATCYRGDVSMPMWLREGRVKKLSNKNYYIIRNGKRVLKKKIA